MQNKIDNLDEQQQAKLAKYISRLEKEKQLIKRQKKKDKNKESPRKNLLKLCLQRIKLMKALMFI